MSKRKKTLTKKERKALGRFGNLNAKSQRAGLSEADLGTYGLQVMGVDGDDPVVQQVLRAMATPDVMDLLENPQSMECAMYAQTLYAALDDTTGWEFGLLLQNGDYHINLWRGDVMVDLAMDGDPNKRTVTHFPREAHAAILATMGGVVSYHATHESLAAALVEAGVPIDFSPEHAEAVEATPGEAGG
jgi:hypothetical protein